MASHPSPDIRNYYIGKGVVSFKKDGDVSFRDVGNVPTFEFTPSVDKLDHFSSREGVKNKDRTVVVQKTGSIKMVMEEWTVANLAMAVLGDSTVNTAGRDVIEIFASAAVSGELKFTSTNEVGPRYEWHFLKVDFIPGATISPLSDEWGQLEVDGDVAAVNGSFGTITDIGEEDSESA